MTYLHFVTLNTGSIERITPPPAGVTDAAALDLGRALRDGSAAVSGHAGYVLTARTIGPALLTTIKRDDGPVVVVGVSARSRGAQPLWDVLREIIAPANLPISPIPPAAPWCGVIAYPSIDAPDSPWTWLASYEVELATAWVERRHR